MCNLPKADPSLRAPSGWTPADLKATSSARRPGMLAASWDAIKGKAERDDGQPLTPVQIDKMAPSLASSFGLPETEVREHLGQVQLFLGGPAAHTPWNAVTIGHDIYVRSQDELKAIEGWQYRRWLSHECGHVMQFAQTPSELSDTQRVRRYLGAYVGHLAVGTGCSPGAVFTGLGLWMHENLNPFNSNKTHIGLQDAMHDTHVMESQAERAAQAFVKTT
ncbi:hypothetical protein ABS71_18560 [bacterium SCN 62-11]|nr:hypothetical protein [Candidatus Eremiobacteraeota bacterium]ODT58720.1 MAG: hypothetical protein ABS71_18560 [bacterium SCN 62-11]